MIMFVYVNVQVYGGQGYAAVPMNDPYAPGYAPGPAYPPPPAGPQPYYPGYLVIPSNFIFSTLLNFDTLI